MLRIIAQTVGGRTHLDVKVDGQKRVELVLDFSTTEGAVLAIREVAEAFFEIGAGERGAQHIPARLATVQSLEHQALEMEAIERGQKGTA